MDARSSGSFSISGKWGNTRTIPTFPPGLFSRLFLDALGAILVRRDEMARMGGPKEFAQFTDDELSQVKMDSLPGSNDWEWANAELEHRDRKRSKRNWVGILGLGIGIGALIATAWPYLVWWITHGFRFR